MKFPWTLTTLAVVIILLTSSKIIAHPSGYEKSFTESSATLNDGVIKERLQNMRLPFDARYSTNVKTYIKRYVFSGYKESQEMLGRASLYFPIFEHYLSIYQLPQELKYLPMVESTLLPKVNSHAGAAGLWQFVPVTARYFGLTMNDNLDERLDPYKSTEAAVKYLSFLYDEFQDWPLVLAAYNCGAGRVRKALRYANCDNFWDIVPYLPRESQQFVPAFIAAAYLVNYYDDHGLSPEYLDYDLQDTRTFRVTDYLNLRNIAYITGVPTSTIKQLNPGFIKGFVPKSKSGNFVIIPTTAAPAFRRYLANKNNWKDREAAEGYFKSSYTAVAGDRIETLAMLFRCEVTDIVAWNNLSRPEVVVNQHLTIFLPEQSLRATP